MKVPAIINFSDIHDRKIYDDKTAEYKALMSLRENGEFKEFACEQLQLGISIIYDISSNVFAVQPEWFSNNELRENFDRLNEDDIDIEADDDFISNILNDDIMDYEKEEMIGSKIVNDFKNDEPEFPEFEPQIDEPINDNKMQVVSLDDVMSIIQQVMGNNASSSGANATSQTTTNGPLQGGSEALKKSYFQNDGNETLNSDFEVLDNQINSFESHVNGAEPYVKTIGAIPSHNGTPEQPGLLNIDKDFDNSSSNTGSSIADSQDTIIEPQADVVDMEDDPFELGLNSTDPARLIKGLPTSDDFDTEDDYCHDEDTELLLDTDDEEQNPVYGPDEDMSSMQEADDDFKHPDLDRITGGIDYDDEPEDDIVDMPEEDFYIPFDEPIVNTVTANKDVNIGGQRVKLILTGVMITANELDYIGEAVKNAGNSLKQINGKGKEINIIVETADKRYTINYVDTPNNKTKTPFSIANHKFTCLEEALERINYKKSIKEAEVFNKIIGEELFTRNFGGINESDIFDGYKEFTNMNDTGWNVMSVGLLNLKNGLNETFSKITQAGKERNTLVRTKDDKYYLLKGNLKERSKVGTKKQIIDLKAKKSLGDVEVIGLFENTHEGLGDIMYEIKRTSIPLLVWK